MAVHSGDSECDRCCCVGGFAAVFRQLSPAQCSPSILCRVARPVLTFNVG